MGARQGMRRPKESDGGAARGCAGQKELVARRGDAPAKKWAMGCAGLDRQRWHGEGMRRPKRAITKSVGWRQTRWQMKRPKRRGMRRPSVTTPNWWRLGGECAGKRNNTKSVDRRRMRRQTKQHQIGGSAANAPANEATPNWWIGGECAGKRSNTKSVDRRRMRQQKKRLWHDDEMRRPNKENAARR